MFGSDVTHFTTSLFLMIPVRVEVKIVHTLLLHVIFVLKHPGMTFTNNYLLGI